MQQLLIVRHAIALEPGRAADAGMPDSARPLTEGGIGRMQRVATGLRSLLPELAVIGTSPYRRCRETAQIVARAFANPAVIDTTLLSPGGNVGEQTDWIAANVPDGGSIAVVGHDPDVGLLAAWLLAAVEHPFLGMEKGGACLLAFPDCVRRGGGRLLWAMSPTILSRLAMGV